MTAIFTDCVTGVNCELHPSDGGFWPERHILDTEAASYAAFLDQEAEDALFDHLAEEAELYNLMMAGF